MWSAIRNYFLYTHLFIGCCAGMITYGTLHFFYNTHLNTSLLSYSIFVGLSTVLIYHLHRYLGSKKLNPTLWPDRYKYFRANRRLNLSIFIIALFIALYLLLFELQHIWWLLIPAMVISGLYILPSANFNGLRFIPFIKIFLIAFVWAWVTFFIPAKLNAVETYILIPGFVERFIFIWALTLPFDLRDQDLIDPAQNVKTIAQKLSKNQVFGLSSLLFILCLFLQWYFLHGLVMLLVAALYVVWIGLFLYKKQWKTTEYPILLDGVMILLACCLCF